MRKLLPPTRMSRPMPYDPRMPADSPLAAALERVGDRWSLLVIEALLTGPRRFNELAATVRGIAPNILTDRLRRLEAERGVRATPYSERPQRFSYALTAGGLGRARVIRRGAHASRHLWHAGRGAPVVPDLRPDARGAGGRGPPLRLAP